MSYRIIITSTEPTDQGNVRFACTIETDKSGTWQTLTAAPAYIDIPAQQILAILRRPISQADKRGELLATFKSHTRALPVLIAAITIDQVNALVPAGWPITVSL